MDEKSEDHTKLPDFEIKDPRILEKEMNIHMPTYNYKSSAEYATAVNIWLWQCYNWQCMSLTLPYLMSQSAACRAQTATPNGTTDLNRNFPRSYFPNQNFFAPQPGRQDVSGTHSNQLQGTDFIIPSLFKRIAAEVIDFFILLILKVIITYIAVDFFDFVNFNKYDLDLIRSDKVDYIKAIEMTSEIVALELTHRFVVCLFEALCISNGVFGTGGATPGKTLLKLRVVSCQSVIPLDFQTVRVYPGREVGLRWALLRAFIKNFSMAFIFPIFFTFYIFQHNRTSYDIICKSIVVEELPEPRNRQQ